MLSYLGEVSVRVLALGLVGWVVAWALRRRGAAVRHAVWASVLVGMLGLLAATAWVPEWRVVTGVVTRPAVTAEFEVVASAGSVAAALPAAAAGVQWPDWRSLVLGLYILVALVLVVRVGWLVHRAWGLVERAEAVDGYEVEVRESDEVLVPMTVGWRRKVVLLPAGWRAWDEFALRAVMAHEVAHVTRGDWGLSLVAAVNRAVFWFHPMAWWVERRLLGLAEEACDGAAIEAVGDGRRYAEVVLGFAAAMSGAGSRLDWAATAMARSSRVGGRIERILEGEMNWTRSMTLGGWAVLVLAAVPVVYGAAALRMVKGVVLEMPAVGMSLPAAAMQQGALTLRRSGDNGLQKVEALYLTAEQATEIEAEVERNPEDLALRGKLLQYYFAKAQGQEWARHLIWLVERHPESHLLSPGWQGSDVVSVRGILADDRLMETLRGLWQRATVGNPSNVAVLRNAARFYTGWDLAATVSALRRARIVDPQDQQVVRELNQVEARAWMADGEEREALRRLLEESKDSAEIGYLGRMLINRRHSPQGDIASPWLADGVKLLERAKALEPSNHKWAVGLELARLGAMVPMPGAPPIPEDALKAGPVFGVTLRVRVGADGAVKEAVALEGPPLLLAAAVQSAMKDKLEARGQEYETAGVVMFRAATNEAQSNVPKRITVGGNVAKAMLVEKVEPVYPPLAQQAQIQGVVLFNVVIGPDGGLLNLTLQSGHPLLVPAAVNAVRQWRYKPTLLNGQPVEVVTQVEVPFTLPQ